MIENDGINESSASRDVKLHKLEKQRRFPPLRGSLSNLQVSRLKYFLVVFDMNAE